MTDLLEDFETYFISKGVVAPGAFFRDTMLNSPDSAVAIYEYQGQSFLPQIAGSNRSIQLVARDKSATAAKLKARELFKALDTDDGIMNLTVERWCMLYLRQPPFKMKVDELERVYYCFNVGVTTYND